MVKIVLGGFVGAFLIFYVMTSPDQAAYIAKGSWHFVNTMAHGVGDFVDKLAA